MIRFMRFGEDSLALIAAIPLLAGTPGLALAAAAPSGTPSGAWAVPVAAAAEPSPPPADLEPLPARADTGILGKKIIGPDGKELGLVIDVLVDA
jgi:hypothetical protein